jgi:hypothetical protein
MINEFFKVGDEVQVPGVKTPVTITYAGKVVVHGIGPKGRKFGFVQNDHDHKIYCRYSGKTEIIDMHEKDTIESKLKIYEGQDVVEFLEDQIEYFLECRARSRGKEREHYQNQLDITGKALSIHKMGHTN